MRKLFAAAVVSGITWGALLVACGDDSASPPAAVPEAGTPADGGVGADAPIVESGSDTSTTTDSGDSGGDAGGMLGPGPYSIVYSGTGNTGIDQRTPVTIAVSASGDLDQWTFGAQTATRGTAATGERWADTDSLLGRWNNGAGTKTYTAKEGFHYGLVVAPTKPAPTSGTIAYTFGAATAATIDNGTLDVGSVTAKLGVAFGASGKKAGLEITVVMPGDATYTGTTTGGAADPAQSTEMSGTTAFPLVAGEFPITSTGASCAGGGPCKINVRCYLGGGADGVSRAVVAWVITSGGPSGTALRGALVFKAP